MKKLVIKTTFAIVGISLLAACGGGGGGSSSSGGGAATPVALNLNAAYSSMITNGSSALYTLDGSCTGTSTITNLPSYSTMNGAGKSVSASETIQVDTLSTASKASTYCTSLFNSQNGEIDTRLYNPTTGVIVNGEWTPTWMVYENITPLPASVTAGSSGTVYTTKDYKGTSAVVEKSTLTYSVGADSATTLLVTFTEVGVTAANVPTWTVTQTYRLNANNTLTAVSVKIQTFSGLSLGAGTVNLTAATSYPTLNIAAAQASFLSGGGTATLGVSYDGMSCSGSFTAVTTALSNFRNTETFTSNISNCGGFSNNGVTSNVYDSSYQLTSSVSVQGSSSNTTTTSNAKALPSSATVGATGKLYDFTKGTTGQAADENGSAIYFIAADSSSTLMAYQIRTDYTLSNGTYQRRLVQAYRINANNTSAYSNGYFRDGADWYFKPL